MAQSIELSENEQAGLERILSIQDLQREKRLAYPFWILAGLIFIVSQAALLWSPLVCVALLPYSFAALMIGMGRYGYYKLFRLLHHQHAVIEQRQNAL